MLRPDEVRDAIRLRQAAGVSSREPMCDEGRGSLSPPPRQSARPEKCDGIHHHTVDGIKCSRKNCVWDHGIVSDNSEEDEC